MTQTLRLTTQLRDSLGCLGELVNRSAGLETDQWIEFGIGGREMRIGDSSDIVRITAYQSCSYTEKTAYIALVLISSFFAISAGSLMLLLLPALVVEPATDGALEGVLLEMGEGLAADMMNENEGERYLRRA